ncbi:mechanosensitive ion channel [Crocinitomicaceae bacterium]|nr:mechanosensitive ion channel [Crocinitomicaceae bacterium]
MEWHDFMNFELLKVGSPKDPYIMQVWNILLTVLVLLSTIVLLYVIRRVVERPKSFLSHIDKKRRHSIYLLAKYFTWVISIVLMIESLGFGVTILLGASAALLVGIGFGLQTIFADLISGFFLLFEGTIKIGDVVESDDGLIGKVSEINLRSSEIITRDNVVVIIPNSKFVSERVINWSHNADSVRFMVDIGVAYGTDVEKVIDLLLSVMKGHKFIEKSPEPFVRFKNFGDSSLDFQLFFWTQDVFTVENLKSDIRRIIYRRLKEEGITIPFPQRDIHIISDNKK